MNIEDWKSQIKRGSLEFGILLMISKRSYYGYEIISELNKWQILAAKESTIYPLLRRLLKEGFCPPIGRKRQKDFRLESIIRLLIQAKRILLQCLWSGRTY